MCERPIGGDKDQRTIKKGKKAKEEVNVLMQRAIGIFIVGFEALCRFPDALMELIILSQCHCNFYTIMYGISCLNNCSLQISLKLFLFTLFRFYYFVFFTHSLLSFYGYKRNKLCSDLLPSN